MTYALVGYLVWGLVYALCAHAMYQDDKYCQLMKVDDAEKHAGLSGWTFLFLTFFWIALMIRSAMGRPKND